MGAVFPDPDNLTTPLASLTYINNLTDVGSGPMLGTIIYFVMVCALYLGMKSFTTERAAVVALFVSSIIAILLRIFGWLNNYAVYLALILLVFSMYQLWNKND